ncbi:MAG: TonB-dependent receptor, partial [Gammaproteobacteria bacterium]|nr:TonB-dependent receptor [Gammaproteobacteria bacterium]
LRQSQRDWGACNRRPRLTDQDGGGDIDNRDPATGEELCFGPVYGFAVSPFGWVHYNPDLGPGADPASPFFDPLLNGALGIPWFTREPAGPLDNQGDFYRDTRSPEIAQMISESDRFSVTAYADKDLTLFGNNANAFLEFYYNQRDTRANGGHRQLFEAVPASNPTNPFGDHGPLPAAFGRGFAALPVLMSYGLQDPDTHVDVWRYNLLGGLEGELSSNWSYNGHLGYSYSKGSYEEDNWLDDRVVASLDATLDENGNLVCRQLDRYPGCIAPNMFTGGALLEGTLPADYVAYISKVTRGETIYKGWQASGYVTGTLFSLWDDEAVSLVVGGEVRREEIDDEPDPESQNDNVWGSTSALITAGKDTVREVFVELELPLLPPNTPLAEEVLLNLSSRYTDYNSYGDDWTERAQLSWQFNPWLRLRGTYGTSFRAPDLFEQFLGDATGFLGLLVDPCVQYGENNDPGDPIYDNCASLGLPPNHGSDGGPGVRAITGGNPDLQAETSKSWTAGLVLSPEQLGASLALNFFEIELKNTVASPSVGYVLFQCLNSAGLSHPFCDRIAPRDVDGFLTDVDASLLNVGIQRTKGLDVDLLYERAFSRFDLAVDLSVTHLREQYEQLLGEEYELAGRWGFPKWTAELDIYVDWREWRFLYSVGYVGHSREERQFDPGTTNVDRIRRTPSKDYHTLSARYTSPNDWQVIASVRNLFDSDPPIVSDGQQSNSAGRIFNTIPGAGYDLLGRTFVLQISKGF